MVFETGNRPRRRSTNGYYHAKAPSAVSITDDDVPSVTVSFRSDTSTVAEGGTQTITVTLSADPERTVEIPITATDQDGATSADYSGVPSSVTFASGETSKSFTFNATSDSIDDNGESVKLNFGTLPASVTPGTTSEATVTFAEHEEEAENLRIPGSPF